MAYTIVKSDGQVLTTIADGQINTDSTSLGLPGRNYAGYGQVLDTNFVHVTENFASTEPPANPLRGQLWYNTNNATLYVCPEDGEAVAANWLSLATTSASGNTTFGGVTVIGTISANNAIITNNLSVPNVACQTISVAGTATIQTANITTANIGTLNTTVITTGGAGTAGALTGNWTLTAGSRLQSTYADLAERFESDQEYEAGTVVELGGNKEITAVKYELSEDIFGVISHTAGYLMNAGAGSDRTHPPVAVSGRVKVNVIGPVVKGQRLVSAGKGLARAAKDGEATAFNTIGRSLVTKTSDDVGVVEAIVTIR
jgi:hypothetical protein